MNSYEISKKVLEKAAFGYKTDEVDSFIVQITAYVKKLEEENKDFENKMNVLAEKVAEYREQEESMREVLLSAQRVSTQVIGDARTKAEKLVADAEEKSNAAKEEAKRILDRAKMDAELNAKAIMEDAQKRADELFGDAKKQAKKEEEHLAFVQKQVSDFKAELLSTYKTHLDLITKMPETKFDDEDTNEVTDKIPESIKTQESKPASATFAPPAAVNNTPGSGFTLQNKEEKPVFSQSKLADEEIKERFQRDEASKTKAVINVKDLSSSNKQGAVPSAPTFSTTAFSEQKENMQKSPLKITFKDKTDKTVNTDKKYESKFGELEFGKHSN